MTSSRKERRQAVPVEGDARKKKDELPAGLSSMWRLCKLGYQHEPQLIVAAFSLSLLSALPDALLALWFKWLGEGAIAGNWSLVRFAAIALGVSAAATWILQTVSTRVQRRFRDKVTIALESHVATLLASIATIAHQERPEYLDRLAVLRNQVFMLDHMYMSLFTTCAWILRLVVTIALLMSIHPALALLALFALPTVLTSSWRPAVERSAYERGAQANRLARHLFDVATTAAAGKEVRVTGIGDRLVKERRLAWEFGNRPIAAARWRSAAWHTVAWAIFGAGYVGAIVFVSSVLRAPAGDVLLALAAGSRLSYYVGATVGEIGFLRGIWMDAARRLAWLEDYASCWLERPTRRHLHGWHRASASSTSRLCTRALNVSCSTMSMWSFLPDRLWRSLARTGRGSPRSSSCLPRCTNRRAGAFSSTTLISRGSRRLTGGHGLRAPSRTSSALSSAPVTQLVWVTFRGSMTSLPLWRR